MVVVLADGHSAEVGLVGNEGMTGLALVLGSDNGMVEALMQGSGTMLRIETAESRRVLDDIPDLSKLLLRYGLAIHQR